MNTLYRGLLIAVLTLLCGCAGGVSKNESGRLLVLNCVVESFEPEALVFYGLDTLPYDARSRVSLLQVISPSEYRDRRIAVDLGEKEKKDEPGMYLRFVGAYVTISLLDTDLPEDPKRMVPIDVLKKAEPSPEVNRASIFSGFFERESEG